MDGERVQVQDRVFVVRGGQQVYGRVSEIFPDEVDGEKVGRVTTHKGDAGSLHPLSAIIVSHRYVPQEPPKVRVSLLPPARSSEYR